MPAPARASPRRRRKESDRGGHHWIRRESRQPFGWSGPASASASPRLHDRSIWEGRRYTESCRGKHQPTIKRRAKGSPAHLDTAHPIRDSGVGNRPPTFGQASAEACSAAVAVQVCHPGDLVDLRGVSCAGTQAGIGFGLSHTACRPRQRQRATRTRPPGGLPGGDGSTNLLLERSPH